MIFYQRIRVCPNRSAETTEVFFNGPDLIPAAGAQIQSILRRLRHAADPCRKSVGGPRRCQFRTRIIDHTVFFLPRYFHHITFSFIR